MAGQFLAYFMKSLLAGWMPFRAGWSNGAIAVDWCHLGRRRFADPFFHQTVARAMAEPFNLAFRQRTPIERLSQLPQGLPVAGFIFHMSRCGSTLCTQALAALPDNIVISEAAPIHTILRAPEFGPATPENAAEWLRSIINAFAQPRFSGEKRVLIKFTASDVLCLPLIARVFPDVPWLFLYRNPLEILASHRVNAGPEFMAGIFAPQHLGLPGDLATLDEDTYRAHCLAALGQAALAGAETHSRSLFLDHRQLPRELLHLIPQHFGISLAEADRATIWQRAIRHSKNADAPYADDTAEKRAAASDLQRTVETIVGPTLAALEARRL